VRIIFLPDNPDLILIGVAVVVLAVVGVALYQWIRPPALPKLREDPRYQQALEVYVRGLAHDPLESPPTPEERQAALDLAAESLTKEHAVPADEARKNLRLVVAAHDKELSYELRHEALVHEQNGAYDLALDCFERAARLQVEHDREDHEFLQRCIARVRGKVRPGRG